MYPWRCILLPTDFSTASEWVYDDAVRVAGTTGAEIVVLHVRRTWSDHPDELRLPADPSVYEYAEQIELERVRDHIRRANAAINTRMIVRQGPDAAAAIASAVVAEQADLVVIATHARHHVAHLLVGSTTRSVLNDPPAPVLAARYGVRHRSSFNRKLVPVHLRQPAQPALDLAVAMTRQDGGAVHLITVCSDDEKADAAELLERLGTAAQGVEVRQAVVSSSHVQREILRYAEREEIDAVFLNASENPGDVKIDIIRHAPSPVFIVPSQ
ncbi:MAG TPA: universal stress protein [Thermoanaerobaculia bacterium]|nr:universal stress protein [Thermoanaerobaculia bacterium]